MGMPDIVKKTDVFILCGGLGKRLRKFSGDNPKAMVLVGNRPFLELVISYLASLGFRRFILGVGYKSGAIKKYYSNHKPEGLSIVFSEEKTPLDTGGALKNARSLIKSDPFLVLNGDSFCVFNPSRLLRLHRHKKSYVTILSREVPDMREYGQVKIDASGKIVVFNEKSNNKKKGLINSGVYIFSKKAFSIMPPAPRFSLEKYFFPELVGREFFAYSEKGFFIDIGTPKRFKMAQKTLQRIFFKQRDIKIKRRSL